MVRMLNRIPAHAEVIHTAKPNRKAGSFIIVKRSGSSSSIRSAQPKQAQTVITYKQPSKLARQKQYQVDILLEWNVRLQEELIKLRKKETQARYLAYRDELTGLSNRDLLEDRLNQAIPQARRCHKPFALLLINLDEFTRVNDMRGRAAGDKLLQMVAQRLSTGIRGADTACRYAGDEFVLILLEIESASIIGALATEVRVRLGEPYIIDEYEIRLTVSVGAAVYPDDGQTYEELMKQANVAMYSAKSPARSVSIVASP